MKKFTLAVATVIALGALSLASCSKSGDATATPNVAHGDSVKTESIRYFNMDLVFQNYTLAQEILAEQQRMAIEFQSQAQQRDNQLQRKAQEIQQKINNNVYLSPQSAQADEQAYYQMQTQAQQWAAERQQQIAIYQFQQNTRLNDSVRSVIKDICVANNIDAVLPDTLTFYVNPALDITDAVITMLNARYKSVAPADTTKTK